MKPRQVHFAYTRVSTVKQGDGVSLEAQRDAIVAFAERKGLNITRWYEEKETAAKRGRPVFDDLIKSLQKGEAAGLIVHKIDRSARNFSDWARIGELLDSGVDVHLAHENLDMRSRGGRLTADVQAVIAADYVRNLREECLKGMEGRLKQGLFPWAAPIGYLDQGGGKPKTPDPKRAPFVRQAFELYATQQYSLRGLQAELNRRGFRNRSGKPISKTCLENMMSNPFYHGYVRLKRTERIYKGLHEPLISTALFNRVQDLKSGRQNKKETRHNHIYRKLIACGHCGRSLIGEWQKGRVYYRCHTSDCPTTSIREDIFEAVVASELQGLKLSRIDEKRLTTRMRKLLRTRAPEKDKRAVELQLSNVKGRLDQLTDALLDQLIDKATFSDRKQRLLEEQDILEKALAEIGKTSTGEVLIAKYLELTKNLILLYRLADRTQKARLAKIALSNCSLTNKSLSLEPQNWLQDVDTTLAVLCGAPVRDRTRTFELIQTKLAEVEEIAQQTQLTNTT
ncbi:recombinase family protein [Arenibacterium sp. CAU 1754]